MNKHMATILELNAQLELNANDNYNNGRNELLECKECKINPDHEYDSFGMPMHKLECPKCGKSVQYPKEWEGVKNLWNKLQLKSIVEAAQ